MILAYLLAWLTCLLTYITVLCFPLFLSVQLLIPTIIAACSVARNQQQHI